MKLIYKESEFSKIVINEIDYLIENVYVIDSIFNIVRFYVGY